MMNAKKEINKNICGTEYDFSLILCFVSNNGLTIDCKMRLAADFFFV